ncbi:MAG: bacillithiol biosynthesis cysteine-adding enzyme BshC [Ignavibacteria bacterium]
MTIKYSEIPINPQLFIDYIEHFDKVKDFFLTNFRDEEALVKNLENFNKDFEHRQKLVQILKKQYTDENISERTRHNIGAFLSENTFAIVTGQQLGILLGPLYTIYKVITSIKLADALNEKYPELKFVPIFWLEGDDHDFNEVNWIKILDNENSLTKITYEDGLDADTNRGPMGNYQFDLTIENFIEKISSSLRETEFKSELIDIVKKFYYPGASFKSSFVGLLKMFFDKYGLIVFDPQDVEVKDWLREIFKKDIENYQFISEELILRSAQLEENYHAQVKIKPINLFYIDDGGRYLIEPAGESFRLKGKRKKFTYEQLIAEINLSPEKFSPNVVLRPICQDFIFPTAYYVAGPSEICYHAQIYPYYAIHNLTPPILYPRASVTLIELKVQNILDKYNLKLQDFFNDLETLATNITDKNSDIVVQNVFEEIYNEMQTPFQKLKDNLIKIEPTLEDVINNAQNRVIQTLGVVKEKALAAQKKRNEIIFRQIYKTSNLLFPDENLQEREINFIYFANKYSINVLDFIFENLDINLFEHQIIQIK